MNDDARVPSGVRPDANHLAMKVARSILDAAHDFTFTFDGASFTVAVERLPSRAWPASGLEGLNADVDGPWPAASRLRCSWPGGSVYLIIEASYWRGHGQYRHMIGLRMNAVGSRNALVWITLALPLRSAENGSEVIVEASFTPFKRRSEDDEPSSDGEAAREVMSRANLPFTSDFRVEAFRVAVPEVDPVVRTTGPCS